MLVPVKVRHLYISPGHNFFAHHEKPPGKFPVVEVSEIECVAGRGIQGDRFFDFKRNYKGQVTFFSQEIFSALCAELNLSGKSPGESRRNIVTEGADLNALVGKEFEVQGVKFLGTAECSPCHWMDKAFAPGAEKFLQRRGGLRAQILTDGRLRVEKMNTLTAALFVGGESRRMGADKAALLFHGEPLWHRQLNLLGTLLPETILISARTQPAWCPPEIKTVLDESPATGPMAGLVAALEKIKTTHLLAFAVDLPLMPAAHLQKLCSLIRPDCGVVPQTGKFLEPLCAIYPKAAANFASGCLKNGETALQPLVKMLVAEKLMQVQAIAEVEAKFYFNANSAADFEHALRQKSFSDAARR